MTHGTAVDQHPPDGSSSISTVSSNARSRNSQHSRSRSQYYASLEKPHLTVSREASCVASHAPVISFVNLINSNKTMQSLISPVKSFAFFIRNRSLGNNDSSALLDLSKSSVSSLIGLHTIDTSTN